MEKLKTHILCSITFIFSPENRAVYEIMWKNVVARQVIDDNMAQAHCMLDTLGYKNTHTGCVIFIAFLLQQWLHERA